MNPLPTVTAGTYGPVCVDAADITLVGTPAGGTWSGTGVTGDQFDPSAGTSTVTYTYSDLNGCTNSASTTITVSELATVANAGTYAPSCDGVFNLNANQPGMGETGLWTLLSGTADIVAPNSYNSVVVNASGPVVLEWTITNGACSSSSTTNLLATTVGASCDDGDPNTVNDVYDSNCDCAGTPALAINVKAILDGASQQPGTANPLPLMRDNLRTLNMIPSGQPYNMPPFSYAGSETVAPAVLAVSGDDAIVDWVLVELRTHGSPYAVQATRAALIQRDGDIVDVDGVSPVQFLGMPTGNYQVAVRHRNHLGIMTMSSMLLSNTPVSIDFTTAGVPTYGTDARKTDALGRLVMWTGNARADGVIRYVNVQNDRDAILLAIGGSTPTAVVSGYLVEDVNLNGNASYAGSMNDRDPILVTIGGVVTNQRFQQLP